MKGRTLSALMMALLVGGLLLTGCSPTPTPVTPAAPVATETTTETSADGASAAETTPTAEAPSVLNENGAVEGELLGEALASITPGVLSQEEIDGLLYMREEEKLARDVYLTLYERWGTPVFNNIARSEQTHTDTVKELLDRYGLPDPAEGQDVGQFSNPDLQALYDQLVAQGSQSEIDALKVGAAIEEIDILDLEERLAQTDKEDIRLVYENLMAGSRNHLRAFVSVLEMRGESYAPQYLDQATYDAIVSSSVEPGMGGGIGGPGGQGPGGPPPTSAP